jgi:hypothetical protein
VRPTHASGGGDVGIFAIDCAAAERALSGNVACVGLAVRGQVPVAQGIAVNLPVLPRPVGIITLKGRTISPLAQLFIVYTRKMAKPMGN